VLYLSLIWLPLSGNPRKVPTSEACSEYAVCGEML